MAVVKSDKKRGIFKLEFTLFAEIVMIATSKIV